jgi:Uma2 family endonuclease
MEANTMSTAIEQFGGLLLIVHMQPVVKLTDDEFFDFCQLNRDLRIERTAEGDIEIMSPAGWETSDLNAELTMQVRLWAKKDRRGVVTDSSGGYRLPNGATRSPDVAWIRRSRLAKLTAKQKKKFLPLCPDFVIELRSSSDRLSTLQKKMREYIANGAELGWLIDPTNRRVYVYRPDAEVECLTHPMTISGEPVLRSFVLKLTEIWEPNS